MKEPSRLTSPAACSRRGFFAGVASFGVSSCLPRVLKAKPAGRSQRPLAIHAGHQHDHSADTLRLLAAFGVRHLCSAQPSPCFDANWSVDGLIRLRHHVESFGISLDCLPAPLDIRESVQAEFPESLLARSPNRDKAIGGFCEMIRNAGAAGIPMLKYNLSRFGAVRSASVSSAFNGHPTTPYSEAPESHADDEIYWECIKDFLHRVVPVAEEAGVRLALHPHHRGISRGTASGGIDAVLGSVDGLKRCIGLHASPMHGIVFCQGTISAMLVHPAEEIHDAMSWFGMRKRISIVHVRGLCGAEKLPETTPNARDIDIRATLQACHAIGYEGMLIPDCVPVVQGDLDRYKAFAFSFGYLQALLQSTDGET